MRTAKDDAEAITSAIASFFHLSGESYRLLARALESALRNVEERAMTRVNAHFVKGPR